MTELRDLPEHREVRDSHTLHEGMVWDLLRDRIDFDVGTTFEREYVRHPGAVAVVAVDAAGRVLLVRQYRHPVRHQMWELPAGLLDHAGEDIEAAGLWELAEETGRSADGAECLLVLRPTPGGSDETIHVLLARGVREDPSISYVRTDEEAQMVVRAVEWDEAIEAALDGRISNSTTVAALLAVETRRRRESVERR